MTRHCDEYMDDPSTPEVLRAFLDYHRAPAVDQLVRKPPTLFAKRDGQNVRVVMASRFGDVGITSDLTRDHGYEMRVPISELSDFRD